MSEQNPTIQPGGEAAMAPDVKDSKKPKAPKPNKSSKVSSEAEAQVIVNFLKGCVPYQADAVRVAVAIANGDTTIETLSAYDREHLNGFLNSTDSDVRLTDNQAWVNRKKKAKELLCSVKDCLDKDALIELSDELTDFSAKREYITEAVRLSGSINPNN